MNVVQSAKRIMIVTGEASGDLHGAKLIHAAREIDTGYSFFGVGGRRMEAAGCEILIPGEDLAVMGIFEVLGHFPLIWRSFQKLKRILHGAQKPDALVLIDFPEFNLRLARQAQRAGVPVLYYVSPQVWAWRRGRVRKIAAVVDSLAAIFPFEPELYEGLDIDVRYVGHPLLDEFAINKTRGELLAELGIPADRKVVGLFPGSRCNELRFMLETLAGAAQKIHASRPDVHFLVPIAETLSKSDVASGFSADLPVTCVSSGKVSIYDVAAGCDAILTVSGTVTLQIALTGTPMAILYKLSPLSYAIGQRLVRVEHIGLANIVAGRRVVPEFIQDEATPAALAAAAIAIIEEEATAGEMRAGLSLVQEKLGSPGCSRRVAEMLVELVSRRMVQKTKS